MSKDWNDTDYPLAYLITFRCYGTWFHGDERGSTDRLHNVYETPFLSPNRNLNNYLRDNLKQKPAELDGKRRSVVEEAIRETCGKRNWGLLAINVRTNHIHVVLEVGSKEPNKVLIALKANATRKLREEGVWDFENTPWADKGSKRWHWNEKSVEIAIDYVINGQGRELPKFE